MQPLSAYAGRRVLVTGHTGFKGSWLALWLQELGAEVTGLALPPPTTPSHFELIGLRETTHHEEADVRDYSAVDRIVRERKPELVFHLAAQPIVLRSYVDPRETFETNVQGTVNVLEAIRRTPGTLAAVMITSDKCYENVEWEYAYRETDRLGGRDPYSASKGAAELVISSYARSFFGPDAEDDAAWIASVRAGNVIGGGDWAANRIIPDCVRALSAGERILVRNPASVRPWQHVLEPLSGYLLLGARLLSRADRRCATSFNFGPDNLREVSVGELVDLFINEWGEGERNTSEAVQKVRHEAGLLMLSSERARRVLGWRPTLSSDEAIQWTASWYHAWHQRQSVRAASEATRAESLAQIREYTSRIDWIETTPL